MRRLLYPTLPLQRRWSQRGFHLAGKCVETIQRAPNVTRAVRLAYVATSITVAFLSLMGWQFSAGILAGTLVLIGGLIVFQVRNWVGTLLHRSDMLCLAAEEAESHYTEVLWRIVRVVESRDQYTEGHSERVADMSLQIARVMGMSEEKCSNLRIAAQLHDLGMLAVSQKILSERDRLGVDGYRTVKTHPEVAYKILKSLGSLREVLPAIRHHHERMNGTGYPAGLRGDAIPLEARILAVADAYDAMTHDRPQRQAMTAMAAMHELRRCAPAGYDPDCVEALAKIKHFPNLQEAMAEAMTGVMVEA